MRLVWMAIALLLGEIAGFVVVGRWLGVLPVLGLVVLAALVGIVLVRSTGPATTARVHAALRGRESPLVAAGSAAFRVAAGVLFLVPGFLTDALAIILLLPPVQAILVTHVSAQVATKVAVQVAARARARRAAEDIVIEGEVVDSAPPQDSSPGGGSGWTRH